MINNKLNEQVTSNKFYDNDIYFPCYSPKLHHHLREEGFECIDQVFNELTQKYKWIYKRTNALNRELTLWRNSKES